MSEDIKKYAFYIAEYGNGMVMCKCGLPVANDKMKQHLEHEHKVKVFADMFSMLGEKKNV